MHKLVAIFRNETSYFFAHIKGNTRRVVYSNIFHAISIPLISVFLSAFIWRTTGSFFSVAIYKLGEFFFSPIAFYLNGFVLKRIPIQKAFLFGSILSGVSGMALVALGVPGGFMLFVFGAMWGLGNGFYWANRNYLELKETTPAGREYFFSMLSAISGLSSILVPLFAGWFIVFGELFGWYAPKYAYMFLFALSFLLMLECARVILKGKFKTPDIRLQEGKHIVFSGKRRILYVAQGLLDETGFISSLLLLFLFGNEGALGTGTAIISLVTIIATYVYGRFSLHRYEKRTLLTSSVLFLLCAGTLFALPSMVGVAVYVLFASIAVKFFIVVSTSLGLSLADRETHANGVSSYPFIVDNERFLNAGRILGIGALALLALVLPQKIILFYGVFGIAVAQLCFVGMFFVKRPKYAVVPLYSDASSQQEFTSETDIKGARQSKGVDIS